MSLTKEDVATLQQRLQENELFQSLPEPSKQHAISEALNELAHQCVDNMLDDIQNEKRPKRKPRAKKVASSE